MSRWGGARWCPYRVHGPTGILLARARFASDAVIVAETLSGPGGEVRRGHGSRPALWVVRKGSLAMSWDQAGKLVREREAGRAPFAAAGADPIDPDDGDGPWEAQYRTGGKA